MRFKDIQNKQDEEKFKQRIQRRASKYNSRKIRKFNKIQLKKNTMEGNYVCEIF